MNVPDDVKKRITGLLVVVGAPEVGQFGFQLPASSIMNGIVTLHHDMMAFLVFISVFVLYLLVVIGLRFNTINRTQKSHVTHHNALEIIWTIIPTIILVLIALPSFVLLYSMDELNDPHLTFKIIGRQWYWSYEYVDVDLSDRFSDLSVSDNNFDAFMDPDVEAERFRLLVSNSTLYFPIQTPLRLLVTSSDVIHSWAVPSLGVKVDACPGRLSQVSLYIDRRGYFFGQCSELCGLNHAFMPINACGVGELQFYGCSSQPEFGVKSNDSLYNIDRRVGGLTTGVSADMLRSFSLDSVITFPKLYED